MSGSIDDEVVRMRFDNSTFETAVATTLATLSKLRQSLNFSGAGKGLGDVESTAKNFSMSNVNDQIDNSARHWSPWRSAGLIAFATLVHQGVLAGERIVKSFTLDPVKAGFENYETQINAVQTILANTGLKGAAGLSQVNGVLAELNTYANQTIYSFSEMAKNIGTFTAAGVALKPATNAIKGIANLAALSGSTSEQASTAMYQLSQAIAANKVGLQDWNSVVNAGMGGKVFQEALFNTGKLQKTLKGVKANETFDQWTKAGNSFRNSLQSGWITGKVLTDTLSQFTGDLTDAQLKAKGYNADQIKQIQELAKTASGAATKIKTYTQLTAALKEEVATAYGAIFKTIFGDINGATALFSGIHTTVENALTVPIYALNTLLEATAKLGGRAKAIDAFKNVFKALGAVVKPIKDAFREIFPATTAKQLADLIGRFDDFTKRLIIGSATADKIKRVFAGLFAVLDIGKQIVMGIVHAMAIFLPTLFQGSGGFLTMAANVSDMVVAFDKALKSSGILTNVFNTVAAAAQILSKLLHLATGYVSGFFDSFHGPSSKGITDNINSLNDRIIAVESTVQKLEMKFSGLSDKIRPAVQATINLFKKIGAAISNSLGSAGFANILSGIQVGLLGGIVVLLKKFFSNGFSIDVGGGFLGKAGEALEGLTGNLKAMQMQLKAKALLEIAGAIALITASVVALSFVNGDKVQTALRGMAIGFGELLAAMGILTKVSNGAGIIKLPLMAASLNLLATSILILTAAVYAMSKLSWQELQKGLTTIGLLLTGLSIAVIPLSRNSAGLIQAGIAIDAIAIAMNLLFIAVKAFSTMSWPALEKGLSAIGALLAGIAGAMHLMPSEGMLAQSAALVLIAAAMNALYFAVKNFSTFSWKDMAKGLAGVAGSLTAIAIGMHLMPKGMLLQAVALIAVGAALQLIARAVESMAKMSWSEIGKGLTTLAGAMVILAGALLLMDGSLSGAAAMLVVSAALHMFVPALMALSKMSWVSIAKGLGALAAAFALIGIAGLLLTPVIPGMLALGVALGLVGVAMLAFGAGAALLGVGLTAVAAVGGAAIAILLSALQGVIDLLPAFATSLATAFVNVIVIIGKNAPAIINTFVTLLNGLLQAFPKIIPSLVIAVGSLIVGILQVLTDNAPKIIAAGLQLLMDLLQGISNNIAQVTAQVAIIIVKFLDAISAKIPSIVASGLNLLVQFLLGIANGIGKVVTAVGTIITKFIGAVSSNLTRIISAGTNLVVKFLEGVGNSGAKIVSAAVDMIIKFIKAIGTQSLRWVDAAGQAILDFINGLTDAVDKYEYKILQAIGRLGLHIIEGLIKGMGDIAGQVGSAIKKGVSGAISAVGDFLGIGGPSKTFADMIGQHIPEGIAYGIDKNAGMVADSVKKLGTDSVLALKKTIGGLSDAIGTSNLDFTPTITPVLDLTQVQKDASKISGLVSANPIDASLSFNHAKDISNLTTGAKTQDDSREAPLAPVTTLKFEQNNYSPESLTPVEIYRQTNNQLSQAKRILGIPVTP